MPNSNLLFSSVSTTSKTRRLVALSNSVSRESAALAAALARSAAVPASPARWLAASALCLAASAFSSTSPMRCSFFRVRSCVSSTDFDSVDTLVFTSSTRVFTYLLVAQAVDPAPSAMMATPTST